jgi:hypothetical protein
VVSVKDPYGRILGFLDRLIYNIIQKVKLSSQQAVEAFRVVRC